MVSLSLYLSLSHTLFFSDTVHFRGSGEDGQLGIGNNEEKEWVCTIDALTSEKVCSVVAGSRNSLAICEDGKVSFEPFYCILFLLSIGFPAILIGFEQLLLKLLVVYLGLESKRHLGAPTGDQN